MSDLVGPRSADTGAFNLDDIDTHTGTVTWPAGHVVTIRACHDGRS